LKWTRREKVLAVEVATQVNTRTKLQIGFRLMRYKKDPCSVWVLAWWYMHKSLLLLMLLAWVVPVAYAQESIHFPDPKTTAAEASVDFDARAAAVVQFNACGREEVDEAERR
jgi:hypothetical protein